MKKKIVWLVVSCLMVAALVLASCAPAAVEEEEEVVTPEEEEVEEVVTPEAEEEVVVEEEEEVAPPQPSPAAQGISGRIANINPTEPTALASLLGVSQELNTAQSEGTISEEEGNELEENLGGTFNEYITNLVDAIDPTDLGALNDFWNLQRIQKLDDYESHCDPETKQYKEEQMEQKFNDYIRNWVDSIDPSDPSLKDIFFLQKIQHCKKYSELATPETHEYKEEQLGEKFNEWVRNAVDNLDPTDPDDLSEMVFLQKIQHSEKWEEYATPETAQYKEEQLKKKFNEWVRNRVDDLDPNDPNFQDELEKLRAIQRIEKYTELATPETRAYKEEQLEVKFGQSVTNLVNAFNPGLSNFMEKLDELRTLQSSDIYQELCPEEVKKYKDEQLMIKLTKEPGGIPRMIGTLPLDGQPDVRVSQSVLIVFDQPMEPASVEAAIEISPAINYHVIWAEPNYFLVLHPLESLDFDTTYTVYIGTEATSEAGMLLEEGYKLNFTTRGSGDIPHMIETLPLDGQTDASVGRPIEIVFDQPMEPASVEAAIVVSPAIDFTIFWQEDNTIAVLQPLASLEFNTTYTVDIGTEAMSADGMPLAESYGFHFITGIVPTPHVPGTLPLDGQADIPSNHPIQIVFDWPMEPASVEAALVVSPAMDYTTTWHEANFVLRIEPTMPLEANTTYTFEIGTEAMSIDGLPMEESFSFSFTTRGLKP